jgi:hypothetical protein
MDTYMEKILTMLREQKGSIPNGASFQADQLSQSLDATLEKIKTEVTDKSYHFVSGVEGSFLKLLISLFDLIKNHSLEDVF